MFASAAGDVLERILFHWLPRLLGVEDEVNTIIGKIIGWLLIALGIWCAACSVRGGDRGRTLVVYWVFGAMLAVLGISMAGLVPTKVAEGLTRWVLVAFGALIAVGSTYWAASIWRQPTPWSDDPRGVLIIGWVFGGLLAAGGIWAVRYKTVQDRAQDEAIRAIKKAMGYVNLDNERPGRPAVKVRIYLVTDAELHRLKAHLEALPQLQELELPGVAITERGLEDLKGLTKLKTLTLENGKYTWAGVEKLHKALPNTNIRAYINGTWKDYHPER
jgi:hypothetical protein